MKLKNEFINEQVIKKSRFITCLNRISNEDDAKEYLQKIKKLYPNATHYCNAYTYNVNCPIQHSSDDGEPKQTAGLPMLNVLNTFNMEDTIVIVVRYFKGIKLGAKGLTRAYANSVSDALKLAEKVVLVTYNQYRLEIPYVLESKINYFLKNNAENIIPIYSLNISYTFLSDNEEIVNNIKEITQGKYLAIYIGEVIVEKSL